LVLVIAQIWIIGKISYQGLLKEFGKLRTPTTCNISERDHVQTADNKDSTENLSANMI